MNRILPNLCVAASLSRRPRLVPVWSSAIPTVGDGLITFDFSYWAGMARRVGHGRLDTQ